jgi:hypothetical protein
MKADNSEHAVLKVPVLCGSEAETHVLNTHQHVSVEGWRALTAEGVQEH